MSVYHRAKARIAIAKSFGLGFQVPLVFCAWVAALRMSPMVFGTLRWSPRGFLRIFKSLVDGPTYSEPFKTDVPPACLSVVGR